MTRMLYPIPEVMEQLASSRSTVYGLISSGALAVVKIGTRTYVEHRELERFVASLSEASAA